MALAVFEILCGCLTLLLLFYYYFTYNFNYWKSRGINGPKPIPIFGNIYNFFIGKLSLGDLFKKIYDEFPDERMIGIFLRNEPVLLLRDPQHIKHVLIKDFSTFPDRMQRIHEKAEPISLNLFRLDSARWRPLRTRLTPIFTSGKLKDMFYLLLECSEQFEKSLDQIVSENPITECRELSARFTTDVIGSCVFGIEVNALNDKDNEFRRMGNKFFEFNLRIMIRDRFRESLPWLYEHFGHLINDYTVANFMTQITKETIEYRKKNNVNRHDFIEILKDFKDNPGKLSPNNITDSFIAAQATVFFIAGFETSSSTMSNALYELAQAPSIQDRVREEINETLQSTNGELLYDSIKKMTYLDMVFQETLRKYPPVMVLERKATKSYTFEGNKVTVPKGQKIYIPIYAIQRDPSIYPNPELFDPERFNEENTKLRNPIHYLPFGDGPRNCIGARFAVYQTKVGLIKVLLNYQVDVCEKTQIPYINNTRSSMMLQPTHGIYVKLTKLK